MADILMDCVHMHSALHGLCLCRSRSDHMEDVHQCAMLAAPAGELITQTDTPKLKLSWGHGVIAAPYVPSITPTSFWQKHGH